MLLDPGADATLGAADVTASTVTNKFVYHVGPTERRDRVFERPYGNAFGREDKPRIDGGKGLLRAVENALADGGG